MASCALVMAAGLGCCFRYQVVGKASLKSDLYRKLFFKIQHYVLHLVLMSFYTVNLESFFNLPLPFMILILEGSGPVKKGSVC